jgi:hypothetical protein
MGVKLMTSAPTLDVFNYEQSEVETASRSSRGQTVIKWNFSKLPLSVPGKITKSVKTKVAADKIKEIHGVNRFPVVRRIADVSFSNMVPIRVGEKEWKGSTIEHLV